jgi:copper chaperone CopZ
VPLHPTVTVPAIHFGDTKSTFEQIKSTITMMKRLSILLTIGMIAMAAFAKNYHTLVVKTNPQIHCESCENTIKKSLRYEKGVKSITTSIYQQTVTVKYDADKTTSAKLIQTLGKAGYSATTIYDKPTSQVDKNAQKDKNFQCDHCKNATNNCDRNGSCDKNGQCTNNQNGHNGNNDKNSQSNGNKPQNGNNQSGKVDNNKPAQNGNQGNNNNHNNNGKPDASTGASTRN